MKIHIYGARGSLPTPSGSTPFGEKIITEKYGGNTTCIYIQADDGTEHIIDAGTGIRALGLDLLKKKGFDGTNNKKLNLYITHTHWDHIQGLPFFTPAYIKGNKIAIYGLSEELIADLERKGMAIFFAIYKNLEEATESLEKP